MSLTGGLDVANNMAEGGNKHTELGNNHSTTEEGGGGHTELGHNHNTKVIVDGGLGEVGSNLAMSVPMMLKKKVWKIGKKGLFSWKTQKAAKPSHANKFKIHTSHSGPNITAKSDSENKSTFVNWLLTAGRGEGGVGEIFLNKDKENKHTMKTRISGAKNCELK